MSSRAIHSTPTQAVQQNSVASNVYEWKTSSVILLRGRCNEVPLGAASHPLSLPRSLCSLLSMNQISKHNGLSMMSLRRKSSIVVERYDGVATMVSETGGLKRWRM